MKFNSTLVRHVFITALTTALLLQVGFSAFAGKITYNLNENWSDSLNPNGVWSYNYNTTPISTHQTFWWGQAGWGDNWTGDSCMIKGSYFDDQLDPWGSPVPPAHDWQPGDVMMHAVSIPYGGESSFLNFTWTSPANGKIDIAGRAWDGEIHADRDVAWLLIVDGAVVAQRTSVIGLFRDDAAAQFSANRVGRRSLKNISVKAGSVVEFRVVTQTYYGHWVGVNATITLNRARSLSRTPGFTFRDRAS